MEYLLIERFVVLEERLECFEHLDLRRDAAAESSCGADAGRAAAGNARVPLHDSHPEGALVARDKRLEVFEEELRATQRS